MAEEKYIEIGGRLHSIATGNISLGANEVFDDDKNKKQSDINAETDAALEDRYTKEQTYSKSELNNLITTPNQQYVSVTATAQTTSATDVLPATGAANTIYRVGNWDGTQYNDSVFSEYAWNGSAYIRLSKKSQVGEVYDISLNHADTKYADLEAALDGGNNIPQSLRKGGMSIKFVQSSDNKYVQYRLMSDTFNITEANWQGVDDEPTAGSNNLVKSGGVADIVKRLGTIKIPMIDGAYIKTNLAVGSQVDITPNTNAAWKYAIFPVEEGDKLTITAYGGMNPKPFAFVDANYIMVENTDLVYTEDLVKIAPTNSAYVIINDSHSGTSYYLSKKSVDKKVDVIDTQISTIQDNVDLNRELIEMSNNCLTIFNPASFTRGTITNSGEVITTIQYSIANTEIQTASEDIYIDSIDEDFQCNIYYYVSGVYDDAEGNIQTPFIIQSGKEFRLLIMRAEVDMHEIANIETFVKAISIKTKIGSLVEDDSTPLGKILHDGGYTCLFHHLGCIGDSLSSGAVFKALPGGGYYGEDKLKYSWGQVIARMCGITCHNFSFGGASTRSWIQNFIDRTGSQVGHIEFLEDYPCEAYTIALSVNDADHDGANYVPIGSPSDINLNDMDACADTYYGNYAHIIMFIKSIVPNAKIFLITDPRYSAFNNTYREAVRYISTLFDNVYLIDLYAYGKQYYTNDVLLDGLWVNGHLTAQGYIRSAWHISTYIDWIVRNNPEDFQEVPYILES